MGTEKRKCVVNGHGDEVSVIGASDHHGTRPLFVEIVSEDFYEDRVAKPSVSVGCYLFFIRPRTCQRSLHRRKGRCHRMQRRIVTTIQRGAGVVCEVPTLLHLE